MKLGKGWERIGYVGVDAGLIWVGDPCYILHKDPTAAQGYDRPPSTIGKDWGEFCSLLRLDDPNRSHWSFSYELGHEGLGVCVSSGYGDGTYPVYAKLIHDPMDPPGSTRVAAIFVDFVNEVEEEEA